MKDKLLGLIDSLVKKKDIEGLNLLRNVILELSFSGFEINNLSLIELNEYIDEAQAAIEIGKTTEEILALPIRQLFDT